MPEAISSRYTRRCKQDAAAAVEEEPSAVTKAAGLSLPLQYAR
jgi:hypothetical protein